MPLLHKVFAQMKTDVCGFQEVSFEDYNQLNDLFKEESDYFQFHAPTQIKFNQLNHLPDQCFNIDGNAIVATSKICLESSINSHNVLHLSADRTAQMYNFTFNGLKVNRNI